MLDKVFTEGVRGVNYFNVVIGNVTEDVEQDANEVADEKDDED